MQQAREVGQKNRMHPLPAGHAQNAREGALQRRIKPQNPCSLPLSAGCFAIACRAMDALGDPLGFFLTGGQACDLDGRII